MRQDLTELVFILDKSGSMAGLESDTIGGYNAMLAKQKKEDGEAYVTTVLFDSGYELLHDRINIRGVAPITEEDYVVCGSTALLDAIGKTIRKIARAQAHTAEAERAGKVIFVITTDGLENASRSYTYPKIREMIALERDTYGWEFIFLGANMDAVATAAEYGIKADRAANFSADHSGVNLNFETVHEVVSTFRSGRAIREDWKDNLEKDSKKR